MARGDTTYSDEVPGERMNYDWAVRFDKTDGFIGITQYDEHGKLKDRVLLSPDQLKALVVFARARQRKRV
jgi:hypothetical protein